MESKCYGCPTANIHGCDTKHCQFVLGRLPEFSPKPPDVSVSLARCGKRWEVCDGKSCSNWSKCKK